MVHPGHKPYSLWMRKDSANKTKGRWGKRLRRLLAAVFLLFTGLVFVLWSVQRFLVFPGAYVPHNVTLDLPENAELWVRDTAEGQVEAWLLRGRGASAEQPGPAVVFAHGNGELINIWHGEMGWYTERGYTVLLPEYRGFGRSEGSPSQTEIVDDLTAFYDRLAALDFVDPSRIIYHGRSLGGGVAAQLAARRKPYAMILASTFTSVQDAALGPIPVPGFMIKDPFPVEAVLQKYDGPVLILHGDRDVVTPLAHARRNAAAAKNSTLVIYPDTGHNDMPGGHGRWEDILSFLDKQSLPWQVVDR